MKSGNDHIQKRTSGKPSLKRRPSLVELFDCSEILSFRSAEAPRGGSSVTAKESSTGQRPPLTRRNTNAFVRLVLQTLWRLAMARLRSEKLLCVCTRSPFIPAPRGGVRVAKHARQLACFVNTQR